MVTDLSGPARHANTQSSLPKSLNREKLATQARQYSTCLLGTGKTVKATLLTEGKGGVHKPEWQRQPRQRASQLSHTFSASCARSHTQARPTDRGASIPYLPSGESVRPGFTTRRNDRAAESTLPPGGGGSRGQGLTKGLRS
ncbi:hypothetical protein BaRGS_00004285 [Batillaria attramentaria]|uniref:Uncharacterized protein n=1 Tax=Batillaria attramentaria TaxID=370345 RepID=A0ABD0LYA9_9CAEN